MVMKNKYMKCSPDLPLIEAAKLLISVGKKNLIVVNEKNKMIGTLSSSDILNYIVNNENLHHEKVVKDVMIDVFVFIYEGANKKDIVDLFKRKNISYIPVLDHNCIVKDVLFVTDFLY